MLILKLAVFDATKFIIGCICHENGKKELFRDKKKLWSRILELGDKENKRNKTLKVYAHNHSFDFHGYADLYDKQIKWFCLSPFITARTTKAYNKQGKEYQKEYF